MSKLVKLSILGATSAVLCLASPIGGSEAFAAYGARHYGWHVGWHRHALYSGRSAYRRICEHRTAYAPRYRYIIERRTAYVAAPAATIVAPPVVAATPVVATYPAYPYGYGYGGPGIVGAGAGLLGGILNVGLGGPGWGPGYGWGYGPGWRRRWWW